jgi:DNA polymerase elongation subunit (family B)
MSEIDRFYSNALLFGHDPTPRLVAVELDAQQEAVLFFRDPAPPGDGGHAGPGPLRRETAPLRPFVYLSDARHVEGFPLPYRLEPLAGRGFYRFRVEVDSWSHLTAFSKHLKQVTGSSLGNPTGPFFLINDEVTQYLMSTGRTLFKGMEFEEVHRLQLDIETYCAPGFEFPNSDRESDRIIVISLSDNFGWERCLSATELSEKEMLQALVRIVRERDPDVIEGHNLFRFDLPYLEARARRHRVPLQLGRDGSRMTGHPSRFSVAERTIAYPKYSIFGRHVIDTMFLAQLYDVTYRNLESFGLKDIARHFGLSPANRTYIDGEKISWTFDNNPALLLDYAMDDVRETRAVAELLARSYFIQTQIFPFSFQNAIVRGNATKIDHLFIREYLRQGQAIPVCPVGRPYEGGYTDMRVQGVIRRVLHCDVRSLYPSVMLAFDYFPKAEELGIFKGLLKDLREFRLEAKGLARRAPDRARRDLYESLQSTFKVLINSFYGYLGFSMGHFADFDMAAKVTAKGRELIKAMVAWLEEQGATVIEIDTDGIYFIPPAGVEGEAAEEALIERMNRTLPAGIEAELDGRYEGMFSYKVKNYVLLGKNGQLIIKGSGLRSRSVELFQRRFMEQLFAHLLGGTAKEVGALYHEYADALRHHRWSPLMFAKRESLQDSLAVYQQKVREKRRPAGAAYELAIASGRDYQPGDQVSYYVAGTGRRVKVFESSRLLDQWRPDAPDENVPYYLAKLDEVYKKFEPFVVAAGGPSLASLTSGQISLIPTDGEGEALLGDEVEEEAGEETGEA